MKDLSDYKIGSPMFCAAMIIVLTFLLIMVGTSKVFGQELNSTGAAVLYCEETTEPDSVDRLKCYANQREHLSALETIIKYSITGGTTSITIPIYAGCLNKNTNETGSVNYQAVFKCFGDVLNGLEKEVEVHKEAARHEGGI